MNDELDKSLHAALRSVDPGEAFTDAVMARVGAQAREHKRVQMPRVTPAWRWLLGAGAATVVILVLVDLQQARQMREGLEARQALIQALRVTGQSLELANRAANDTSASANDPGSGV